MLLRVLYFTCFTNTTATYSRYTGSMTLIGTFNPALTANDKYTCKAYDGIQVRARVLIGSNEFISGSFVYVAELLNATLEPTAVVGQIAESMANFEIIALGDTIQQSDVVHNLKIQYFNHRQMFAALGVEYGSVIKLSKMIHAGSYFVVDTEGTSTLYFCVDGETKILMQTTFRAGDVNIWQNASQECNTSKRDCAALIYLLQKSTNYQLWYEVKIYQNNFVKQQLRFTAQGETEQVMDASGVAYKTPCCYFATVNGTQLSARYEMIFRQNVTTVRSINQLTEISDVRLRIYYDQFYLTQSVSGQHAFQPGYVIAKLILCLKSDHTHCFTLQSSNPVLFEKVVIKCRAVVLLPYEECIQDISELFDEQEILSSTLYYQTSDAEGRIVEQFDVLPSIEQQCFENAVVNVYENEICVSFKPRSACQLLKQSTPIQVTLGDVATALHTFSFPNSDNFYCIAATLTVQQLRKAALLDVSDVLVRVQNDLLPVASVNSLGKRAEFKWGWVVDIAALIVIPLGWWGIGRCSGRRKTPAKRYNE